MRATQQAFDASSARNRRPTGRPFAPHWTGRSPRHPAGARTRPRSLRRTPAPETARLAFMVPDCGGRQGRTLATDGAVVCNECNHCCHRFYLRPGSPPPGLGGWRTFWPPRLTPTRHAMSADSGRHGKRAQVWRVGRVPRFWSGLPGPVKPPGRTVGAGRGAAAGGSLARAGRPGRGQVDLLDATANAVERLRSLTDDQIKGVETATGAERPTRCCSRRRRACRTGGHGWRHADARRA